MNAEDKANDKAKKDKPTIKIIEKIQRRVKILPSKVTTLNPPARHARERFPNTNKGGKETGRNREPSPLKEKRIQKDGGGEGYHYVVASGIEEI